MQPQWKEFAFGDYHEVISWELRYVVRRYMEYWESVLYKEPNEQLRYKEEVEMRRLTVVVLTCVWLESVINFYLCSKCSTDEFEEVDRWGLERKWSQGPQRFVPNYSFQTEPSLASDLRELIARRNVIVHSKPGISIDGDNRHQGNEPSFSFNEHAFMARCTSLPARLIEHLLKSDGESFIVLSTIRILCGNIDSEFRKGERWIQQCSSVPEPLVQEIMAQGHDKETAKHFAVCIGSFPRHDSDGNVLVRRNGKELARLRPLAFFKKADEKL